MPVPKGHGYVFAVEAKHCRGVRAPETKLGDPGLGIACTCGHEVIIDLGYISKASSDMIQRDSLQKRNRQMGQIDWLKRY